MLRARNTRRHLGGPHHCVKRQVVYDVAGIRPYCDIDGHRRKAVGGEAGPIHLQPALDLEARKQAREGGHGGGWVRGGGGSGGGNAIVYAEAALIACPPSVLSVGLPTAS